MSISTAYAKQPHFTGIPGYTPLAGPLSQEEIAALPYQVLVAEIRHYITIAEQKQAWIRNKNRQQNILKGAQQNARVQPHRPTR